MSEMTRRTRRASWEGMQPELGPRQQEVLNLLYAHPEGLTAWECAARLEREVYTVRPRLTELSKLGLVETLSMAMQAKTNRPEAVWTIIKDFQPQLDLRTERQHDNRISEASENV